MRYLDICSGISAPTVAWSPLGWTALAYAEIADAPRAILRHHYPDVPLVGDFTAIKGDEYGPVELLVGGTPCQSFSIAGLRGGLADDRGNLALEYLRLADRTRPRWLVWENVPGVLSSNDGRDLGAILGGMVELGYGIAWRVLDAQFCGVPQRRRRLFVIGYLGDWRRAGAVLFERHGLSGNSAPRREAREGTAAKALRSTDGGIDREDGHTLIAPDTANCLTQRMHKGINTTLDEGQTLVAFGGNNPGGPVDVATALNAHDRLDFASETFDAHSLRGDGFDASEDGTGRGTPLVPVAFAQNTRDEVRLHGGDGQSVGALAAEAGMKQTCYVAFTAKDGVGDPPPIAFPGQMSNNFQWDDDLSQTLGAKNPQAVAFQPRIGRNGRGYSEGVVPALGGADAGATSDMRPCIAGKGVRRLTPRECERLQGFPDDYTLVPYRGRMMADGPRYKCLGNSMAVPVIRWIGERIDAVEAIVADRGGA